MSSDIKHIARTRIYKVYYLNLNNNYIIYEYIIFLSREIMLYWLYWCPPPPIVMLNEVKQVQDDG